MIALLAAMTIAYAPPVHVIPKGGIKVAKVSNDCRVQDGYALCFNPDIAHTLGFVTADGKECTVHFRPSAKPEVIGPCRVVKPPFSSVYDILPQ